MPEGARARPSRRGSARRAGGRPPAAAARAVRAGGPGQHAERDRRGDRDLARRRRPCRVRAAARSSRRSRRTRRSMPTSSAWRAAPVAEGGSGTPIRCRRGPWPSSTRSSGGFRATRQGERGETGRRARAAKAYVSAAERTGDDPVVLVALDRLFVRLGDSTALADVLERRIALETQARGQGRSAPPPGEPANRRVQAAVAGARDAAAGARARARTTRRAGSRSSSCSRTTRSSTTPSTRSSSSCALWG